MTFGKRILILVPHPDDEVVAATATIGRAINQASEIFALYLTTGCIARETMWPWERSKYEERITTRREESLKAAQFLGITPVGWSDTPARHLWKNMDEAHKNIKSAISANNIDQIWVPAYEGGNADHDALNAIGSIFTKRLSVLEFAEYNFFGNKTHSQEFFTPTGKETIVELTMDESRRKNEALEIYKSEKMNLGYVKTKRECFRPLAQNNYSVPPHEGTLWYARFQWVPFKHPRVDFSKPKEVSETITSFLASRLPQEAEPERQP
ncbi:MAG: PIG-L family deacetylase [Alphaproteobacteria bacterium]|nr:PIG-L family deacetylase [Alphaproteobacteria bacterium]